MIEFQNVSKEYDGKHALTGINLTINDGEFVFIMGKSGAGKSTLLKLLNREIKPSEGKLEVNDIDLGRMPRSYLPKYRRKLGMVFQDFRLLPDRNVYENVAFAQRVIGRKNSEIKENVPEVLRKVGLGSKYKSMPSQLSGGEQQRVAIARAMINEPDIIIADEPTGNLDAVTADGIMHLLDDINKSGTTVIVVTHSREIASHMNKRIITLEKGVIVSDV